MKYLVCSDCMLALANDDYSGLSDERYEAVKMNIEAIGVVVPTGYDERETFRDCECCGAKGCDRLYEYQDLSDVWEECKIRREEQGDL